MATARLVEAPHPGQTRPVFPYNTTDVDPVVGRSIDEVRGEVDDAYAQMKMFLNNEPDYCMRMISGHSARISELRVKVMRIEDLRREWQNIRTRDLEPCLQELERQYNIASRLHSVRELDWKMEQGER